MITLLLSCFVALIRAQISFDLTSANVVWSVQNANQSLNIPSIVPGYIHSDLKRANIIGDPRFVMFVLDMFSSVPLCNGYVCTCSYRFNDDLYRWIALDNWTFTTTFTLPSSFASKSVFLQFDGLDTVANISIDNQRVASVANQFRRYVYDVTRLLSGSSSSHTLEIAFESAIWAAANRAANYPIPVPASQTPGSVFPTSYRNFLRKEQDTDAWDW